MLDNEKIIIVDENDKAIGTKKRNLIKIEDIYRTSSLWIMNSKKEILFAQRSFNKKTHPGLLGPAVAGTVAVGEDYKSNIIKETKEEIGISNINPIEIKKVRAKSKYNHFTQWFFLKLDLNISEFTKQDEEVERLEWIPKEVFLKDIKENPQKYLSSLDEDFIFKL